MNLTFEESGTGEPVLLVMGLGAAADAWQPHTDAWSRRYRCIAVNNRGAGSSPVPKGPYSTRLMADDLAQLIHRLELGPVRVVGLSMGGAIAQELAIAHPELVRRLVLVATWARCDNYTTELLELLASVRRHSDPATFTALLQAVIWTPDWFSAHLADLTKEREQPLAMPQAAFEAQIAACAAHDARDRLGQIDVPTLVTAGSADMFIRPGLTAEVAGGIPGAEFEVFDGGGHTHHWEHLDRFNDLVERWLA